jgi:hypothetical protein
MDELKKALFDELDGNFNEEEKRACVTLVLGRGHIKTVDELRDTLLETARLLIWTAQHWGQREA